MTRTNLQKIETSSARLNITINIFKESTPQIAKKKKDKEIWSIVKCVERFDEWMKMFTGHSKFAKENLISWLSADSGFKHISNYSHFCKLANALSTLGYETLPPPSESEYERAVEEGCTKMSSRQMLRSRF